MRRVVWEQWSAAVGLHANARARISPRVIRVLGGNPSKYTLQGTNTYVVGQGPRRILIDTGEGRPAWRESLAKVLADEGITIEKVLLTHWHLDHVSGVKDVLDLAASSSSTFPPPEVYKHQPDAGQTNIAPGQIFETTGATLRALFCPGHAVDHMALILAEEQAMFTGDNVLGHGTAVFSDLGAYMSSLQLMHDAIPLPSSTAAGAVLARGYPGHGDVIPDVRARIAEYIGHRRKREVEVLQVLGGKNAAAEKADGSEAWTSMQLVKVMYRSYPVHLHEPAEGGVRQVLQKLADEGKVQLLPDGRWKTTAKATL